MPQEFTPGGVAQVSLVEQPEFSYNLSVQGGDITFLPGLEVFINSFVRDAVLKPYVLPEGFRVPLEEAQQMEVCVPSPVSEFDHS